MNRLRSTYGLLRSLIMYYGVPGRGRKMRDFYGAFIGPNDLCFDIGAHVGNRVRTWLDLGGSVVAVEPQPSLAERLRNVFGTQAEILELAVGDTEGEAVLKRSRMTPTVSTLSVEWINTVRQDPRFQSIVWDEEIRVPVVTLDKLIDRYGEPAFTKIDVEGFECQVLRGLSRPLAALSFEYIPVVYRDAVECIDLLERLAPYEYQRSERETMRFCAPRWCTGPEMAEVLAALPMDAGSGDIYARRL